MKYPPVDSKLLAREAAFTLYLFTVLLAISGMVWGAIDAASWGPVILIAGAALCFWAAVVWETFREEQTK